MSEPTYRVDLSHHPEEIEAVCWRAEIVRLRDDELVAVKHHESREEAFAAAVRWAYQKAHPAHSSSVFLSEDGDLLDPHEVQR